MHVQARTNGKPYDKELQLSRPGLHSDSAEISHWILSGSESLPVFFFFFKIKFGRILHLYSVICVSSRQKSLRCL